MAKWDGQSWSALGDGVLGNVRALAVFDDGTGPGLYVGGNFRTAGGNTVNCIARWDGTCWTGIQGGVWSFDFSPEVRSLAVFDDGSGPALYAGLGKGRDHPAEPDGP